MKRILIILLIMMLSLSGCKVPETSSPTVATTQATTAPTEATIEEPPEIPLQYEAEYIRTDGYHENFTYPGVAVLDSVQDLQDYYNCYHELYDLAARDNIYADSTPGFENVCSQYDETFFRENFLIFVIMQEPSGSIRHQVTDVYLHPSDGICICVDRDEPEVGTSDMAQWHIVVELERRWLVESPNDVQILIDGELAWDGAHIVNPQPQNTINEPPEGILFTPEGEHGLTMGGYHWTRYIDNDTMETVIADQVSCPLPRDCLDPVIISPEQKETIYALNPDTGNYEPLRTTGYLVKPYWETMPDEVSFTCWGDGVWVNSNVESQNVYTMDDFLFYAFEGAYVYEITATWYDLGGGTGGSAHFYVYIIGGANPEHQ